MTLSPHPRGPKASDVTIDQLASEQNGIYSPASHHLEHNASLAFVKAHERRLEALRRQSIVTRDDDGSWRIPSNYLQRAAAH